MHADVIDALNVSAIGILGLERHWGRVEGGFQVSSLRQLPVSQVWGLRLVACDSG